MGDSFTGVIISIFLALMILLTGIFFGSKEPKKEKTGLYYVKQYNDVYIVEIPEGKLYRIAGYNSIAFVPNPVTTTNR